MFTGIENALRAKIEAKYFVATRISNKAYEELTFDATGALHRCVAYEFTNGALQHKDHLLYIADKLAATAYNEIAASWPANTVLIWRRLPTFVIDSEGFPEAPLPPELCKIVLKLRLSAVIPPKGLGVIWT